MTDLTTSAPAPAASATDAPADPRPALPWYRARSSWAAVTAVAYTAFLIAGDPAAAEEARAAVPQHLEALVAAALALWAYAERLLGRMRIVL